MKAILKVFKKDVVKNTKKQKLKLENYKLQTTKKN